MIYGEKVKYARNKLGLSRMKFAVLLGMTERSVANVENCKDESMKLGYDKMAMIIEFAQLPLGWWFMNDYEVNAYLLDDTEIFIRGEGQPTKEEARELRDIVERLK